MHHFVKTRQGWSGSDRILLFRSEESFCKESGFAYVRTILCDGFGEESLMNGNFVTGEAKVGSIRNDKLVEQDLKTGDIYTIDAGSVFYIENTGEGQRLQIICSIDTSESLTWHAFQVP